mgnify:FL=1
MLVVDYVDGPSEGFVDRLADLGPCYFRLIAWDDVQDDRLFIAVAITLDAFDQAFAAAGQGGRPVSPSRRLVDYGRMEPASARALHQLLQRCTARLCDEGALVLARTPADVDQPPMPLRPDLASMLQGALSREQPDDLASWRAALAIH